VTDDDNLAFLREVMAHSKAAAGLPQDWGRTSTPLTPAEELEDAPRPARLRSGMSTAELLPYGGPVRAGDGSELFLERLTCPAIQAAGGGIDVCDPVSLAWQGPPIAVDLRGDEHAVEVAVLRHSTPRGELLQPAVAVVGDLAAVTRWTEFPVPGTRLSIDKGCGAFIARDHVAAVADRAEDALPSIRTTGLVPVELDGVVVGALFGSGDGPGGYEVMLGQRRGLPVALLVDLGVLPR
jgi:hypothetical protein